MKRERENAGQLCAAAWWLFAFKLGMLIEHMWGEVNDQKFRGSGMSGVVWRLEREREDAGLPAPGDWMGFAGFRQKDVYSTKLIGFAGGAG